MLGKKLILQLLYYGTFVPWFLYLCASSILRAVVILLENDVFKLLIYLDIYIFVCGGILPARRVEASQH